MLAETNKLKFVHFESVKKSSGPERPEVLKSVPKLQNRSPIYPTLRANPYPEVTDLFCRLPLSTLFYQLEAVNLGDLLRL